MRNSKNIKDKDLPVKIDTQHSKCNNHNNNCKEIKVNKDSIILGAWTKCIGRVRRLYFTRNNYQERSYFRYHRVRMRPIREIGRGY